MPRAKGQNVLGPDTVHASLIMPRALHRALATVLFRQHKSLSQWGREAAAATVADGKVKQ